MSSDERLLSVAEIARRLGVPESTVHYWKNRFAQYLPSVGSGRQKRFRPEAVEVFRVVAEMFSLGHSASDVMEELGKRFPLTAHVAGSPEAVGEAAPFRPAPAEAAPAVLADTALRMAAAIGQEIARSIGEGLGRLHPAGEAQLPAGEPSEELAAIRSAVEREGGRIAETSGEVERLSAENADLKGKLTVLEAELVRLRKDRRELEKYLLDKIKSVAR